MKKLQFIDIGKPFRIIGKICKDIERTFRFKGINVNFIVMMIDYIGFAFILKWNLHSYINQTNTSLTSLIKNHILSNKYVKRIYLLIVTNTCLRISLSD